MNSIVHKISVIASKEASDVHEMLEALQSMTLSNREAIAVQDAQGYPLKLFLVEEVLSDESVAYTIVVK